jgi:hypothetical protein
MIIRVQYNNHVYDMISDVVLHRLLDNGKIKKFYRYSEKRWITVATDPIRRQTHIPRKVSERRTRPYCLLCYSKSSRLKYKMELG